MAANAEFGIILIRSEANATKAKRKIPWKKFDHRVLAPLLMLADERTISE